MTPEDISWALAEGRVQERKLWIRFRQFPDSFPRHGWPERMNIFWQMSEFDGDGSASEEEDRRLVEFERDLVAAVERDAFAILSAVLTCGGRREFVIHTTDPREFLRRLSNMPQQSDRYPIEIHHSSDYDWSYFDSVAPPA